MSDLLEDLKLTCMQDASYPDTKAELLEAVKYLTSDLYEVIEPTRIPDPRLRKDVYLYQIKNWEYCYCRNCKKIISSDDLEATDKGIRCKKCNSYDLEGPGWISCPHHKVSSVKCPRAGRGIKKTEHGYECQDRCSFRKH